MASSDIYKAFVWDNAGATFLARIRGNSGAYVTQASLSQIALKVFDLDGTTPDMPLTPPSGNLTISQVVFDGLQAGALDLVLWTKDSLGYNFKHAMPATAFPAGSKGPVEQRRYRVEYVFTPASGEKFPLVFDVLARNLRSFAG